MSRDELTERLRATFLQELDEQVRELNSGLLRLEQRARDAETIRTLFRSAHTIKGAARVAAVPVVEDACHVLESVFAQVRDGTLELDGSHFSLLFATVDALADAGARLRRDEPLEESSLAALLPRLRAVVGADDGPQPAIPPVRSPPAAAAPAHAGATGAVATPPAEDAAPARAAPPDGAADMVRVRADRLDLLLSAVGELIVATGRAVEHVGRENEEVRRLQHATSTIADVVRHLRLRPFADVVEALPRAIRDIAASENKDVALELEGEDVEADRLVVDALRDPLLHLVRNAVDHGIEPPAQRERLGKPRRGRVRVAAELAGGRLVVSVSDDGAGLDEKAIAAAMRARGLPVPDSRQELANALLGGGLTSRHQATAISGRGVGIDLVTTAMDRIGGTVDVSWQQGRGTTFTLECPPSPATIRALLFGLGAWTFALPTAHIERLRRVTPAQLRQVEGRSILTTRRGAIPVHTLAALLGPPLEARAIGDSATVVVVSAGGRRAALIVDELFTEQEIVVRPLDVDDGSVPYATGAAILPTGRIAIVLGAAALLAGGARAGTAIAPAFAARRDAQRRRILIADDSITTRTLVQSVLETAGYEVLPAVNGEDAWHKLEQEGADMLVADVEMPRMDGFTLTRRVRASQQFATLPVVLVTGLASEEDRMRGMEAGADAYIVKSGFDQADLVATVQQLIGDE